MARASDTGEIAGVSSKRLMREPGEGGCLHPIRIEPERFGRGDGGARQQRAQVSEQMAVVATATTDIKLPDFPRQQRRGVAG